MITCFRCGTPLVQEPDGSLRKGCDCHHAPLLMTPVLSGSLFTSAPISEAPAATIEKEDMRDYARSENLENMSRHMEEHERMCVTCAYLKQCGFKTRCAEYQNMQDIRAYWKDRINEQR